MSEDWKSQARKLLNSYYQSYEGLQWAELSFTERKLILAKVCYGAFGPPQQAIKENEHLVEAYTEKQREFAQKIVSHIEKVSFRNPFFLKKKNLF